MAQQQMNNAPKRSHDLKQWAKRMLDIATGEVKDRHLISKVKCVRLEALPKGPAGQYRPRLSPIPCEPTNNVTVDLSPSSIGGGSFSMMTNCAWSFWSTKNL